MALPPWWIAQQQTCEDNMPNENGPCDGQAVAVDIVSGLTAGSGEAPAPRLLPWCHRALKPHVLRWVTALRRPKPTLPCRHRALSCQLGYRYGAPVRKVKSPSRLDFLNFRW